MIKPISVKPLENYQLLVVFDTGERKLFDVKPYLDMPFYAPLKDETAFKQVFVNSPMLIGIAVTQIKMPNATTDVAKISGLTEAEVRSMNH